jgi:NADH-quinone oxidoreductase subunit G
MLADELGTPIGLASAATARREIAEFEAWTGGRSAAPDTAAADPTQPAQGEAVLATWRTLLDSGRMQDGEPYLAGTAPTPVVRVCAATAEEAGVADGDLLTVATARGSVTLPVAVTAMPDRVVWLPTRSPGSPVLASLAAVHGSVVTLARATGNEQGGAA